MPRKAILCVWAALLLAGCDKSSKPAPATKGPEGPAFPEKTPAKYTGPKVPLTIGFRPGRYEMAEKMDQAITMTIQAEGKSQKVEIASNVLVQGTVSIDPPAAASGERKILYTCTRVTITQEIGGRPSAYDSDRPDSGPSMLRSLGGMVGKQLVQVYSAEGKFLRVDGLESVFSQIAAGATGQGRQAAEQMKTMLEPLLKEMMTRHWGKLMPEGPVGPGDTWRRTVDVEKFPMFGRVDFQFACRLRDIEQGPTGQVAVIDCNGSAEAYGRDLSEGGAFPPGVDVTADKLRIGTKLQVRFDRGIGLATSVKGTISVTGSLTIRPPKGEDVTADMTSAVQLDVSFAPAGALPHALPTGGPRLQEPAPARPGAAGRPADGAAERPAPKGAN